MQILSEDMIQILEQASNLFERLEDGFIANEVPGNNELVNSRIERWCQVVSRGNQELFEQRLSWDNLDIKTVRRVLGNVSFLDEQSLPAWVETLKEVMQASASVSLETIETDNSRKYRFLNQKQPIPFEEVFLPFILVARQKLLVGAGSEYQLLSEAAHAALERQLLKQLARFSSLSLQLEFSIFRSLKQNSFNHMLMDLQDNQSREQYNDFIKGLFENSLLSFFQEYSVLARLLATVTDFWVEAKVEFIQRLASDWVAIQTIFQGDTELSQVVEISPSLSDPHNQGRSAITIKFTSGLKIIYKPKNLGLDVAYFHLLDWLNQNDLPLQFKLLKVINRSTYGWVEFVEQLPCQNEEEAKRFYQRAGMLLCLFYTLEAVDCQYENLIANGEHLVLIDMETLFHPRKLDKEDLLEDADAQILASEQIRQSVLGCSFLPRWIITPSESVAFDVTGLGGIGKQENPLRRRTKKNINTDQMIWEYESGIIPPQFNAVFLNGIMLWPNDYVEEIVDGFKQMYQVLVTKREVLLASDGPLALFSYESVRFIFRDTRVYSYVLSKTFEPKYMRNGVERSISLDILSRLLLSWEIKPTLWPLLKKEIQALEQLDIPFFTANPNSDGLTIAPNQTIERCFEQPSYISVSSRIQQMSQDNLARQIAFIRGSLYSRVAHTFSNNSFAVLGVNLDTVVPLNQEQLVHQAVALAQELQQQAIQAHDGSVTWIGIVHKLRVKRFQIDALDHSLYNGHCGVALFLAALASVTGRAEFSDLALAALQSFRKQLQDLDSESHQRQIVEQIGIGCSTGLGSSVYALVQIAQFLGQADLVKDAQTLASLMKLEDVVTNQVSNMVSESAGAILGLLALHQVTKDSATVAQAITWGKHLLVDTHIAINEGFRTGANLEAKLLTGFLNGRYGIAYALFRLYAVTQDRTFLSAAKETIAYERCLFDTGTYKPLHMTSWHDPSGIALGRLGCLTILDTDDIRQELEIALHTMQQLGLQTLDNLCCGNFGRIEVMLEASQRLSQPEFSAIAQKQAAWVVNRARDTGSFQLLTNLPSEVCNPGFFQGIAGIGYELLRLAYPNILPSVLLWQCLRN